MQTPTLNLRPTIILLGDSITQYGFLQGGWALSLIDYYTTKADIINRGMSGYTSQKVVPMLQQLFPKNQEKGLVIICFGANDASTPDWCQHVPLEIYKQSMLQIVQYVKQNRPHFSILLITPPPVYEDMYDDYCKKTKGLSSGNRKTALTKQYAETIIELGKEENVPVLNLWSPIMKQEGYADGLHLNEKGNDELFSRVKKAIQQYVPEMDAQALPYPFLSWAQVFQQ